MDTQSKRQRKNLGLPSYPLQMSTCGKVCTHENQKGKQVLQDETTLQGHPTPATHIQHHLDRTRQICQDIHGEVLEALRTVVPQLLTLRGVEC